jgi:hypothetical protein
MGLDFMTPVAPYGDVWRTARRLLHAHLHQGVASKYHTTQIASARKLARDILVTRQGPDALSPVVRANFGRTIIKMVYGIDTEEVASEQLSLAEDILEAYSAAFAPGHFLVDFLPFCKRSCFMRFRYVTTAKHSETCPYVVPWSRLQTVCARDSSQAPPFAQQPYRFCESGYGEP